MPFVKFKGYGKSYKPRVSISSRGMISFTQGARKRFNLDNYQYCSLYYDADEEKIGVEMTRSQESGEVVKLRLRATGADIGAKGFLSYFEIDVENTTMYDVFQDEESGWLIIDLKTGRERISRKKKIEDEIPF